MSGEFIADEESLRFQGSMAEVGERERRRLQKFREAGSPVDSVEFRSHLEYVYLTHDWLLEAGFTTANLYCEETSDGTKVWDAARLEVHEELLQFYRNLWVDVPRERKVLFSGGLPGAGKTTMLQEHAGVQVGSYAFLSPDELRGWLAARGYLPSIPGFTPMEVSASAYNEVVHLTMLLQKEAVDSGLNAVYDTTLGYKDAALEKILVFKAADYQVSAIFVDVDVDTALRRCEARHLAGFELWADGVGEGGRLMPRSALLKQRSSDSKHLSKARGVFDELVSEGWFFSAQVYENMTDGSHPVLVTSTSIS